MKMSYHLECQHSIYNTFWCLCCHIYNAQQDLHFSGLTCRIGLQCAIASCLVPNEILVLINHCLELERPLIGIVDGFSWNSS